MSSAQSARKLELLTSWKEIASFLGKGVRTVQRWEATLGLPVIRPPDRRSGIVMARPSDLEAWLVNGRQRSRGNSDGQDKKDSELRAIFSECVQELRRCHVEARVLCAQVAATRESLQHEIERLKSLCQEWDTIRGQPSSEKLPPAMPKIN